MNNSLLLALISGGLLLAWFQGRSSRKVAKQVLDSNADVAAKAAAANEETVVALSAIHTLVNSNLTAARRSELEATRRDLASLRELASFKETQGIPVSAEATEAIELAQTRATELARDVDHKQAQTAIADAAQ